MTTSVRWAREAVLWLGGAVGVVCIASFLAGWLFSVTPLVFASGSMSPTYETGALGIAREVPAASIGVGDVVSVVNAEGNRVTHRVVDATPAGDTVALTLQGDTNNIPDAETYYVSAADRVAFGVPYAGYALSAASSPFGLAVMALLVLAALVLGFGRRDGDAPREGRARTRALVPAGLASVVALGGVVGVSGAAPWAFTSAVWNDTAAATATITTPVTDTTPPVLSNPLPANGATGAGWDAIDCASSPNQICVNATDTGGSGVSTVLVKLVRTSTNECWNGTTFVAGTACSPQPMTLVSGSQYRTSGLTAGLMAAGTYQTTFTATDVAGNSATPLVTTFALSAAPHAQPNCTDTGPNGRARVSFTDTSDLYQYVVQVRRADNNEVTHTVTLGGGTTAGQTITYDVPDTSGGAGQNGNFNVVVQTQLSAGAVNVGSPTTTPVHRDPLSGGNNWRAYCGAE